MLKTKTKQRISLGVYFFLSGFCFASWASRIPTIKELFNLNDAQLGNILLAMPLSSLAGLPISGWLVSKFDSRQPLLVSFIAFCLAIMGIAFSGSIVFLVLSVCCFSFSMRIFNIAMNSQSIMLEKGYGKKINGSFHGLWSTGGLAGVLFSTLMVSLQIGLKLHFSMVALITFISVLAAYPFLLTNDKATTGNKIIFGKPDKLILSLGLLVFFAAICEGGMFDWSGIYFREVVKEEIFTLGYLIFMAFMAGSRFFSDRLVHRVGMRKMYFFSALVVSVGIGLVIIFPNFYTALVGFSLVGIGVSSVFPMTFSLAGKSEKYSPGIAISLVATYAIIGMLLGPPLIGYLSHLVGLRIAFLVFLVAGLMLIPISAQCLRLIEKEQAERL